MEHIEYEMGNDCDDPRLQVKKFESCDLKWRTKEFAKRVIRLCRELPVTEEARLIRCQLFRAGTSVGANYRAVCRARSRAEFLSKMRIVLEETDESLFWMELLVETNIVRPYLLSDLMTECNELVAI